MNLPAKPPIVETEYEVKLGVFEGPLDLLLYLVQKNELNPREISIATITDQYLKYIEGLMQASGMGRKAAATGSATSTEGAPEGTAAPEAAVERLNLSNAGEFLVMAARLMRLKARELLPADQKDELEEMEYELDRQALIQQMLEYQKFKEAARVLRNFEGKNFGAFARGREDSGDDRKDEELEEEAGIFDLMTAFRAVVVNRPKRIPVHEVEIDDVTIEDRMQEVEIALQERGRSQFEDLFPHDNRTIVKVVTLMAMLELCKLDRVVFRQSHAMGPIWIYRKSQSKDFELELKVDEGHQDPLPEFKAGLPELIREQAKQRTAQTALESALRELEQELLNPGQAEAQAAAAAAAAAEAAATAPVTDAPAGVESSEAAPVAEAPVEGSSEAAPETASEGPVDGAAEPAQETAFTEAGTGDESTEADMNESGESTESAAAESGSAESSMEASTEDPAAPVVEADPEVEAAALRDLLKRVQDADEPDKAVGDVDGEDD